MDLTTLVKAAMELGVIPALALFLVFAMQRQNARLTDMIDKREQNNLEMLKLLVGEIAEYKRQRSMGASNAIQN